MQVRNPPLQSPVRDVALSVSSPAPHQGAALRQGSAVMEIPSVLEERMKMDATLMTTLLLSKIKGGGFYFCTQQHFS